MFHIQVSRAAEAFLLLTDDHEALGLDPAEPPAVDPELFEALVDLRALQRQGEEADAPPFHLPG